MAITFNGTTTTFIHTTATGYNVGTRTVVGWCYAATTGELGQATFMTCDESSASTLSSFVMRYINSTDVFRYVSNRATDGHWEWSLPLNQWNALGVSYNNSDVANDPVVRLNFASVTPTETQTPSGAEVAAASGYGIGNNSGASRTWNGRIQHTQFFNVVLTANEMDAALRRPGSIRRGLVSWWPMWDTNHPEDLVNTAFQPTLTAGANGDGAPCQGLWFGQPAGWMGNFTAAAPAAGWARLLSGERNRLVLAS